MKTRQAENRGIDKRIFDFICATYPNVPYFQSLENLSIAYLDKGRAGLRVEPELKYTTSDWRLHGGVVATLLDIAMHAAIHTLGLVCLTLDMTTNYLAPAICQEGLNVEGAVINVGKSVTVAEGNLYDNHGKLVATARGTFTTRSGIVGER